VCCPCTSRDREPKFLNDKENEMVVSIYQKQPSDNGCHFIVGITKNFIFNFTWSRRQADIRVQYCQVCNEVGIKARKQSSTYTGRFRRKGQHCWRKWYWSLWKRSCEHASNSEWLPRTAGISYGFLFVGFDDDQFFSKEKWLHETNCSGPF